MVRPSTSDKLRAIREQKRERLAKEALPDNRKLDNSNTRVSKPVVPVELSETCSVPASIPPPIPSFEDLLVNKMGALSVSRGQGNDPGPIPDVYPELYDCSRYFWTNLNGIQPSVLLPMFNILTQCLFKKMPQSAARASLTMNRHTGRASLVRARGPAGITEQDEHLLRNMPTDIRTIYKIFDLDPEVTVLATCPRPKCCATYMPTLDRISGIKHYPSRCSREKFGKICGSVLVKEHVSHGLSVPSPLRPFAYHHFNDHVASMLSRPEIEDEIYTHMHSGMLDRELRDIISSPALKQLRDPTGLPFLRDCGTEIRLIWAICVDWYNPRTNKASGKSISTGVISMICLSLPPHLRLHEGLIYNAGTIPGPQEPAVDANNEFLNPLINDLQVSYDPGIYFSRTHNYPKGRVSRSSVVPVIADTLASKKVTGHCGHRGKYFCSRCRLPRFEIDNLDTTTWPPGLTRREHEKLADDWLKASTITKQNGLVKSEGIRWSALLKLSYWQPSWIITEGLHVLFLNVIPRHCRDLLGLNLKDLLDEDDAEIPPETMKRARKILAKQSKSSLKSLSTNVLKALCLEEQVTVPPPTKGRRKKNEYISALLGFTSSEEPVNYHIAGLFDDEINTLERSIINNEGRDPKPTPTLPTVPSLEPFITKQVLEQIRQGIAATVRPSWQAALPINFGCAEHGKLKADQWRTAMEFDIPVCLVKILSNRKSTGNISADMRARRIVEHTLDLAMAIAWGISRRTSQHHAERYKFYMTRYLAGIHELYPDYNLKPNHHYALHIPDILLGFGPLHGTWAFALERLIGLLQKSNSNDKIGEMETTVMTTFCRRSNLLRLVASDLCPPILKDAWTDIQKCLDIHVLDWTASSTFDVKSRGSSLGELDSDIHLAFTALLLKSSRTNQRVVSPGPELFLHHHLSKGSVTFADFHTSLNHSIIYFHADNSDNSDMKPAQIRAIFSHKRRNDEDQLVHEVFFAVHEYTPLDKNPFAVFPDFKAAIFHREPHHLVQVVRATQAHCHANQQPWDNESVVMRPIDRDY